MTTWGIFWVCLFGTIILEEVIAGIVEVKKAKYANPAAPAATKGE